MLATHSTIQSDSLALSSSSSQHGTTQDLRRFAIKSSNVILEEHDEPVDAIILVENEKIVDVILLQGGDLTIPDTISKEWELIDYGNLFIFPGLVDSNVHLHADYNDEWQNIAYCTELAAAGGVTTIVDNPIMSSLYDSGEEYVKSLKRRIDKIQLNSKVDFGIFGILEPKTEDLTDKMLEAGVLGLKCFLFNCFQHSVGHITPEIFQNVAEYLAEKFPDLLLVIHPEMATERELYLTSPCRILPLRRRLDMGYSIKSLEFGGGANKGAYIEELCRKKNENNDDDDDDENEPVECSIAEIDSPTKLKDKVKNAKEQTEINDLVHFELLSYSYDSRQVEADSSDSDCESIEKAAKKANQRSLIRIEKLMKSSSENGENNDTSLRKIPSIQTTSTIKEDDEEGSDDDQNGLDDLTGKKSDPKSLKLTPGRSLFAKSQEEKETKTPKSMGIIIQSRRPGDTPKMGLKVMSTPEVDKKQKIDFLRDLGRKNTDDSFTKKLNLEQIHQDQEEDEDDVNDAAVYQGTKRKVKGLLFEKEDKKISEEEKEAKQNTLTENKEKQEDKTTENSEKDKQSELHNLSISPIMDLNVSKEDLQSSFKQVNLKSTESSPKEKSVATSEISPEKTKQGANNNKLSLNQTRKRLVLLSVTESRSISSSQENKESPDAQTKPEQMVSEPLLLRETSKDSFGIIPTLGDSAQSFEEKSDNASPSNRPIGSTSSSLLQRRMSLKSAVNIQPSITSILSSPGGNFTRVRSLDIGKTPEKISNLEQKYNESYRIFLANRPQSWEENAVSKVLNSIKPDTKLRILFQNLSLASSLLKVRQKKKSNDGYVSKIFCETSPSHLSFREKMVKKGETKFKVSPPFRSKENRRLLVENLRLGGVDLVSSYHFFVPQKYKTVDGGNFRRAFGGLDSMGCSLQATWTASYTSQQKYNKTFTEDAEHQKKVIAQIMKQMYKAMCSRPAEMLKISNRKGSIAKGKDADFVIWNPYEQETNEKLKESHVFAGKTLMGMVHKTYLRGNLIYDKERTQPLSNSYKSEFIKP